MMPNTRYNDVKFFLIFIAFVSAFNYYLTYSNIKFNWFLVITYLIDTAEGWLAWWALRSIVIYLDKKMPHVLDPVKRIVVQILFTTIIGLLIIILLTELVSWVVKGVPALPNFYARDIFIFIIWFLVLNGIYTGMYYYHEWNESEQRRLEEKKVRIEGFVVKLGKQSLLVPFDEILGVYTQDEYIILLNWQNKKYFLDKSLDKIENTLPGELFFRVNRQHILHRNAITGFKRAGDGKIDVMVKVPDNLPAVIQVSRIKAVAFKKWFLPGEP